MRRRPGKARAERGAATLLVVAMTSVLTFVGLVGGFVAAVTVAHRSAQAAADLAALAAAQAIQAGTDPCAEAAAIAGQNGARVRSCQVQGEEVWIEVRVATPTWGGNTATALGRARAGPAPSDSS